MPNMKIHKIFELLAEIAEIFRSAVHSNIYCPFKHKKGIRKMGIEFFIEEQKQLFARLLS